MYFAKTAQKLREQMVRFSGELSSGLPKVGPPLRGRDGLRDPSAWLCPADGSRPSARREDLAEEDRGAALPSVGAPDLGAAAPATVDRASLGADRRRYAAGAGPVGRDQEVRREDGAHGARSGRQREGAQLGLLDAEHRWGQHEGEPVGAALWAVVLPCGRRP